MVVPAFGKALTTLRGKRTPQQISQRLAALGIHINRSTLWQYEHGTVGAPDPVVIWGLAKIYKTDLAGLIDRLASERASHEPAMDLRLLNIEEQREADMLELWATLGKAQRENVMQLMRNLQAVRTAKRPRKMATTA